MRGCRRECCLGSYRQRDHKEERSSGVQQDLKFMGLESGGIEVAQQRDKWRARTKEAVIKWEKDKNAKEEANYGQKKAGVVK